MPGIGIVAIQWNPRSHARELGTASLHNAVAVRRIGRALNRERHAAVIENRARHLPAIHHLPQDAAAHVDRQFVHVAGGEVGADIVVAVSILSAQHAGQRRNDSAGRERQETAVGYGVQTMAPGIIRPRQQTVSEALLPRELKTVVVAVRPRAQLRDGRKARVRRRLVRKWLEAAVAHSLISVHLCRIRLVHRACADVLRAETSRIPHLVLHAKAPLHEVGRAQAAVRYRR